jgi:hypothetical protein
MGYRFDGYKKGNKIISISAARHNIEQMKLGFLELGAAHIATYKGVVIDIHGRQKNPGEEPRSADAGSDYSFREIFSKKLMPVFSKKDIAALRFEPVKITFYVNNSVIARFQANRATIKAMDDRIFLEGRVLARSASRVLEADRLTLISKNGFVKTNSRFVIKSQESEIAGTNLTGDIRLNILHYQ